MDIATLAKYAPQKVNPKLKSQIESLMDQRASGSGIPDNTGKKIYFSWSVTGTGHIWKTELASSILPLQLTSGENRTRLVSLSPDGKWIALMRDDGGEEYYGLFLMESGGSPLRLVKGKKKVKVRFGFFTDDSRYLFYTANDRDSEKTSFYRFNIDTGKHVHLFTYDGSWSLSDSRDNGKRLLLRKQIHSLASEIYEYDMGREALRPLFGQGENSLFYAAYGHFDSEIIVLTDHKDEFRRLYTWKKGQDEVGSFLPLNPRVNFDVDGFSIDRERRRILYIENRRGYPRLRGLNARSKQELKLPNIPGERNIVARATSANGRFTIFSAVSESSPRKHYLYDWRQKKISAWSIPSMPEQKHSNAVVGKTMDYPSTEGLRVPVIVYRSSNCQQFACPVIVRAHGGPASQSKPRWNLTVQALAQNNFIVLLPNIRGSSGYGREWRDADNIGKRELALLDLKNIAHWARKKFKRGGTEPKIGIMGGSYGGYATLMMMSKYSGTFDAGFSYVGMTNLLTFLQNTAPHRRKLRAAEYGYPDKDAELLKQLSPTTYLEKISSPLLLAHGANDIRVPAGESVQLQKILEKQKPGLSELILYPDEGHGISKRGNRVHMLAYLIDFFNRHLKASVE